MSLVNRKKNNQGFTLVEALVYFSILLIASVAAVATYLSYSDILRELNARTIITDNAQVVMERVVREVRNAGAVDPFNTIEDIAVGSLGLTSVDSGDVTFTVEGNQLSLSSNGQPAINLTDDNLDVTENLESIGTLEVKQN